MIKGKNKEQIKYEQLSKGYTKIGENIYRVANKKYRVRMTVEGKNLSRYTNTRKEARELRAQWRELKKTANAV